MMRSWKQYLVGGIALTAAIVLSSTMAATSVQADPRRSWDGTVVGGVIGGLIGSTIGKGSGRLAAVGVGAVLGSLYGDQLATRRHHAGVHHRPSHRHRQWHGHRFHQWPWYVQPRLHHRRHHGWKPPHAHAPIVLHPRPRDVIHHRPAARHNDLTECRVLEDGVFPVIACRSAGGNWRVLD